ncbi:MAG: rod shape-determining protein RodA [Treponema sp.]|nr:rod shape-determining protein RodA [Treponema sp.]MCL2236624.1 rod shape-determining protein RodA [Treponema sp.]
MNIKSILGIDYLLLLPVLILLVMGVLFIYSSGVNSDGILVSREYIRQIVWASAGLLITIVLSLINYRRFYNFAIYIYVISLVLLLYTLFFGHVIYNAARWIRIGSFGLQMSEFVKISVIIMLARYLADTDRNKEAFSRFIISCAIGFLPMLIVLLQPDLGTALVYIAILITMLLLAGIKMRYVLFMVSCMALTGIFLVLPLWQEYIFRKPLPFLVVLTNLRIVAITVLFFIVISAIAVFGYIKFKKRYFYWIVFISTIVIFSIGASYLAREILRPYQIMRLIVFLDPSVDPRGAGWNIIQSVTAIGAGGFTGMGFLQGTQSHYRFLPEQSTDFIFSIFSEEAGFLGGLFVFGLFLLICNRLFVTMKITIDPFAKYFCAGLAGMFSFHFIINVGMTMGIMPITGLPLVFLSYGGSSVMTCMIGIGIVLSIFIRRYNR